MPKSPRPRPLELAALARDHFAHPRNAAGLLEPAPEVGTGVGGRVQSGTYVVFQVRVAAEGCIDAARWECMGAPAAIAASSWLSEQLPGCSPEQARAWTALGIGDALHLEPEALSALLPVEDALKAALDALDVE